MACGDSRDPVTPGSPTSPPPTTPGPGNPAARLSGSVYDTAFRPVGGVRIEVIDSPSVAVSTISNGDGSFSLPGTFPMSTTFRASKEGYVTASIVQTAGRFSNYLLFELDVPTAPVVIAGQYTLTLTADPSCLDLPDAVRQRSYP